MDEEKDIALHILQSDHNQYEELFNVFHPQHEIPPPKIKKKIIPIEHDPFVLVSRGQKSGVQEIDECVRYLNQLNEDELIGIYGVDMLEDSSLEKLKCRKCGAKGDKIQPVLSHDKAGDEGDDERYFCTVCNNTF